MTRKMSYPALTSQQIAALRAYREQHGPRWKSYLLTDWADTGGDVLAGEFSPLRPMRSWYGPRWLAGFNLT